MLLSTVVSYLLPFVFVSAVPVTYSDDSSSPASVASSSEVTVVSDRLAAQISSLPEELQEEISSYLDAKDVRHTRLAGRYLQNFPFSKQHKQQEFQYSVKTNNLEIVKLYCRFSYIDPSADNNYAIRTASQKGYEGIVQLLLQDARVDPSAKDPSDWDNAIQLASQNGHGDIVRLLLQDSRVDPSANSSYAICTASANGHEGIVRLLLQDSRVDPSARDNEAIRIASFMFGSNPIRE